MHFGTFWQELQRTERPTVMLVTLQSVKTTVKYKTTQHGDVLAPVTGQELVKVLVKSLGDEGVYLEESS